MVKSRLLVELHDMISMAGELIIFLILCKKSARDGNENIVSLFETKIEKLVINNNIIKDYYNL